MTVKDVFLVRHTYTEEHTLGKLIVGGRTFHTVEKPWRQNKRRISCIPEGVYRCFAFSGAKFKKVWRLANVPNRTAILIHAGNTANDVLGCIAVGKTSVPGGVGQSRKAIDELREILPGSFSIHISTNIPEYP